jgi:hypothetical protein
MRGFIDFYVVRIEWPGLRSDAVLLLTKGKIKMPVACLRICAANSFVDLQKDVPQGPIDGREMDRGVAAGTSRVVVAT